MESNLLDIHIEGARVHNLKNISVTIPRDKLVVITGVSGSGKSSLAFDTIYAEAQRRFMETLSTYARQFIGGLERPDVDFIDGLSPAISIEQKTVSRNPRSTVGTITEIYDFMRLLYARIGQQYDSNTGSLIKMKNEQEIFEEIFALPEGTKIEILSPLVAGRKGHYRELFSDLIKKGFLRVEVDNEEKELTKDMQVDRFKIHDIHLVVDKLTTQKNSQERIKKAIDVAFKYSHNKLSFLFRIQTNEQKEILYTKNISDDAGYRKAEQFAPNQFSFNSRYGACPSCDGLGERMTFVDGLIFNSSLSINDGGILPLGKPNKEGIWQKFKAAADAHKISFTEPIENFTSEQMDVIMDGLKDPVDIVVNYGSQTYTFPTKYDGVLDYLEKIFINASVTKRGWIEGFMQSQPCKTCKGSRLNTKSLFIEIDDKNIAEIAALTIEEAKVFFETLSERISSKDRKIAEPVLIEITKRLNFLLNVGLGYLSINRTSLTLSGGEAQRIRLAAQLGSQLTGVIYVLDEPSIGLHQRDNDKLISSLERLRDIGNTVIVVEHDKEIMERADWILDIGPGAGEHGGKIVTEGTLKSLSTNHSTTAKYLLNTQRIEIPKERRTEKGNSINLYGCLGHNLKSVDVKIPLGKLVVITGVSGSGKSSLINETLYPILAEHAFGSKIRTLPYKKIEGLEFVKKVIEVDQSPIGRIPRSNPATYTGVFTYIRQFYASLGESKLRGYKEGRFSFNVKDGRCPACEGDGVKKIEMNFLPDVYVECDICKGKRYNRETLQIHYKGKNIADVLGMTVEEALAFFEAFPRIRRILQALFNVGLGYIRLGQSSVTLSGGEAQRVKLSTELSKIQTDKTIYILDEPTTGLHFQDISILLKVLHQFVIKGSTVIIIEHNLDVIKQADWVIDMGPESGIGGGYIIAEGTPEEVADNPKSITGKYLKKELQQ